MAAQHVQLQIQIVFWDADYATRLSESSGLLFKGDVLKVMAPVMSYIILQFATLWHSPMLKTRPSPGGVHHRGVIGNTTSHIYRTHEGRRD